MPSQYEYPQSPDIRYAEPGSPIVYPVSPVGSPPRSRDSSRPRPSSFGAEPYIHVPDDRGRERMYHTSHLSIVSHGAGSQALSRSASERSRRYVDVAKTGSTRGRQRSPSVSYYYDGRDGGKKYTRDAPGSTYSNSSYGSRSHSRARHSRSPSCDSCGSGCEGEHHTTSQVVVHSAANSLAEEVRKLQLQLEEVKLEKERKHREEEENKSREIVVQARVRETMAEQKQREHQERLRETEIERKVSEKLAAKTREEQEARAREAAENAKIAAAAEKLLRDRTAAEEKKKAEEAAAEEKMRLIVEERIKKMQPPPQPAPRLTYTKFSKVHLCKEALDERNIGYTEESEHFLVHRVVDKNEQNYLWARTKEIRNYYRQIQEAADQAPTVRTKEGDYVKYVQIAGQPYPIALPVTFTRTPGGGQTQRVDPIKIKWSDIFKPSKF
ncbi:hypothetical protein P167DRAFT_554331 [Morchella conica CCBAS932]|uniref:DUF8035 domain-containing protein n=2 Tax=Morchella sect. Distantes TaxID=1051054 RepID=A0A3N4KJU9_9PEZI|nr:hypothetical protein P167DRAFT_554331 [Morchella conica CCBAS932]